jgi:outer membrane protein assembly factor BamB
MRRSEKAMIAFVVMIGFIVPHILWADNADAFKDPKPPNVHRLEPMSAPTPKRQNGLTFHTPPKPISEKAVTEDWPSFLGAHRRAESSETHLLKHFPKDGPTLVWEFDTGEGFASPAIMGDRLVYLHRVADEVVVDCLHRETGQRFWRFSYKTAYRDRYGFNGGPRSSPVITGDRVFTYGVGGVLHCLELSTGRVFWRRDLAAEFAVPQDYFGVGTTPLVEGDLLIVNVGAPGGPCVAAFDIRTGRLVWGAGKQWGPSYASPVAANVQGRRRVFVFAGGDSRPPTGGLLSIDPANGAIDFRFPWRARRYESVNAASPVVIGNRVLVSSSYKTGSALVEAVAGGGDRVVWKSKALGAHWVTPIHRDGFIYGVDGGSQATSSIVCINASTGALVWRDRFEWDEEVETTKGKQTIQMAPFRASLLSADGAFLCIGELGHLLWLKLSPTTHEIISRTQLFNASESYVLPVVSRGLLYVNQTRPSTGGTQPRRLLCYDLRENSASK